MFDTLKVRFPIALYGEDWNEWSYGTAAELASAIEFVDDSGPRYRAVDAEGVPVRLIVWNVELLTCHRILETGTDGAPDLRLVDLEILNGETLTIECHGAVPVRAIGMSNSVATRAIPKKWDSTLDVELGRAQNSWLSQNEFHATWMRCRTRGRWP